MIVDNNSRLTAETRGEREKTQHKNFDFGVTCSRLPRTYLVDLPGDIVLYYKKYTEIPKWVSLKPLKYS